jgi:hypothetical protein
MKKAPGCFDSLSVSSCSDDPSQYSFQNARRDHRGRYLLRIGRTGTLAYTRFHVHYDRDGQMRFRYRPLGGILGRILAK